jgi:magnesium transporter
MDKKNSAPSKKKELRKRRNNLLYGGLNYNGNFTHATNIQLTCFDATSSETVVVHDLKDLKLKPGKTNWVHIFGLSDESEIANLCKKLGVELPMVQDILNARHIAKLEETGKGLFAVLDAYTYNEAKEMVRDHQSIILAPDLVVSFEEGTGHRFDLVCKAITEGVGQVRQHGSDFLFNLLVSLVVDSYYDALEYQQSNLLDMEDELMEFQAGHKETGQQIQHFRRDHTRLLKAVSPLHEAFGHFLMLDSALIKPESKIFFRDTYDHLRQVMSMLDANRETLSALMDLYIANNDLRMNLIMKQLTVVATIFIPLTFLVGVWGMNFKFMPELQWPSGYWYAWLVMIIVGVGLYLWFRWKYKP